jgi:uncharacterized membrane protein YeaQ/YmgE (transglycosylase-associated protein family)
MPGSSPRLRIGPRRWAPVAGVLLLYALLDAAFFAPVLAAGAGSHVASLRTPGPMAGVVGYDHRFLAWQVTRNARALARAPWRFFEAEHCHPLPHSLALADPLLAMGALAIVPRALGADPIATYNAVVFALPVLAAFAMFLLVREWTASAVAGAVAGVLYGFHPARLANPVHPHLYDTTWVVFAAWFATRLFQRGRWRDALGLAASAILQLGASFYAALAAGLVAAPLGVWLLRRHGLRRAGASRLLAVALVVGVVGAWLVLPYLELRRAGVFPELSQQSFAPPGWYLPGALLFPGWTCLLLAAAAWIVPPRDALAARGDPRLALAAGAALAALAAAGPLWRVLAALLPGLDVVHSPNAVARGVHLAASALAGVGCAGVLRALPARRVAPAGAGILAFACLETLFTGALGATAREQRIARHIAPDAEELRFFEELARRGNAGPILELPLSRGRSGVHWPATTRWLLLAAYHGRPTSACFGSRLPDLGRIESLASDVPRPEALRALRQLGFTTLVYHHHVGDPEPDFGPRSPASARRRAADEIRDLIALTLAEQRPGRPLRRVHEGGGLVAWELAPGSTD